MRKLARRAVIHAVSGTLFITSWVCLSLFALGDRYVSPVRRSKQKGDYV